MNQSTDDRSRRVAEESRQKSWQGDSFLRELFLGRMRPELLAPADDRDGAATTRPEFQPFYTGLRAFLHDEVDPVEIDARGEYPARVLEGLAELGAFGMKIPVEYGGLGLSNLEYCRAMQLLGSHDANVTALLSAHQAIGVPHPVEMFGSQHLKDTYLPRCARGAISAFALTEPAVGSDPARLQTVARAVDGDDPHFVLDGQKLWCTNGTLAEVIVVLARDPETDRINAFVVEMDWRGVEVEHRCHFMGLRALGNAQIGFDNVRVPRENLLGAEGDGLRIALATLNTGRLTMPAATAGAAKLALEICRKWSRARVQWGQPIGRHEAIGHRLAEMAATAYAMECLADVVAMLADRPDRDIRLEAAAAKEWNTTRGWQITDSALQIRGGRGYETERSLAARGEPAIGIERMLRDCRINLIFEGSSEIMHLFIAREAVDKHLEVAGAFADPHSSIADKLRALPRAALFYALWYPRLWLSFGGWPGYRSFGALAPHVRYAARASRKLARRIFHGMLRFGPALEHKQAFLFRAVDVGLEILALVACVVRATRRASRDPHAAELAASFARGARRSIDDNLRDLWDNDDALKYETAKRVLEGRYQWLERGTIGLPFSIDDLRPRTMEQYLADRSHRDGHAGTDPAQDDHPPQGPARRSSTPDGPERSPST